MTIGKALRKFEELAEKADGIARRAWRRRDRVIWARYKGYARIWRVAAELVTRSRGLGVANKSSRRRAGGGKHGAR